MIAKKLRLPAIFLALTFVAYAVVAVCFCYKTTPAVTKAEFPFSITYSYQGETKVLEGVSVCEFSHSSTVGPEHSRYWYEEDIYTEPEAYLIVQNEEMTLSLHPHVVAGYFMGDPLYADYYQKYGYETVKPIFEYYDYVNGNELTEENEAEIMEMLDFEILDYTYAEPITNSFSYSGIEISADSVSFFVAVSLLFLLLCLIFVRKDKEYTYTNLDKSGVLLNFLVGLVALPFIAVVCVFYDLNGGGNTWDAKVAYCIPPISVVCLGLSIALRRKGFSKTGFFIQFAGVSLFCFFLLLGLVLGIM